MPSDPGLEKEIHELQMLLNATAKRYKFNLGHPRVLEVSQKLDRLILQVMNPNHR
ncbi:MAG: Spo0E like sporulation regulatory protein [Paenibacillus sp.]|jgi:hypothetical protein|nr:Spo0E like sporulation regulatory protein [Paenibacillus sp.]